MAMESNTKETKIVRATPKKTEGQQEEQPRVTVQSGGKTTGEESAETGKTTATASGKSHQKAAYGKTGCK